MHLTQLLIIQP